jgi:hypothetical protein
MAAGNWHSSVRANLVERPGLQDEPKDVEGALIALPVYPAFSTLKEKVHQMIEGLFQPTHLAILLAIAVLIFGGRKLPELGHLGGHLKTGHMWSLQNRP